MEYLIPVPDANDINSNLKDSIFTRLVIHSTDRNVSIYPNPNRYDVDLNEEILHVLTAELLTADVPFTEYLVNRSRNSFSIDGTVVSVADGDYDDGASLALAIQTAAQTVVPACTCVYDPVKDGFVFASTADLQLRFDCPNSCSSVLGFASSDSLTDTSIASPYRRYIGASDDIIVKIKQFEVNQSNDTTADGSFAILRKGQVFRQQDSARVRKFFENPISVLSKVRLSFYNTAGDLYDFKNHEHRLEIMLIGSKIPLKYNPLSDGEKQRYNQSLLKYNQSLRR